VYYRVVMLIAVSLNVIHFAIYGYIIVCMCMYNVVAVAFICKNCGVDCGVFTVACVSAECLRMDVLGGCMSVLNNFRRLLHRLEQCQLYEQRRQTMSNEPGNITLSLRVNSLITIARMT